MKSDIFKNTVMLTILISTLSACSSNSATDSNFKKAIEQNLNQSVYSGNCINFNLEDRTLNTFTKDTLLQTLIKNGYINAIKVSHVDNQMGIWGQQPSPGYKLSLTVKGQQAFRDNYFCYGTVQVTKIDNYVLRSAMGTTIASVYYDDAIVGKPDWLTSNLITYTGFIAQPLGSFVLQRQNNSMDLVKGEKGWIPQTLF